MAGDLKTQIEIGVDGSGVTSGVQNIVKNLDNLGKKAVEVGKQASGGIDGIGAGAGSAATKIAAAERSLAASIQRQIAAMEAGSKSGADYYRVLAGQRGVDPAGALDPLLKKLDELNAKQKVVGVSAAQTAAAMRGVPAQFTDIVTSLQGGQAPLTVFLQQGGQLKDMFGGAGAAARALSGYVVGLVNPLTVAAAAAATLGVAAYKGAQEQTAYQRALILSGNVAGVTAGQLDAMAASARGIAGTQGQAAEALAALAGSGQVAAGSMQKFAATAVLVQATVGTSIKDTVKAFTELGEEPLKATEKLNKGMNYLTLGIYDQIKALEDQGRKTEAATVAQNAYDTAQNAVAQKLKANLGSVETFMLSLTTTASRMWDSILAVGRQSTPEAQFGAAQRAVAALQAAYDSRVSRGMATGDVKPQLDAAIAALDTQRKMADAATKTAAAEGEAARISRDAVAGRQANAKWAEAALTATEKTNRALKEYRDNNAKIIAGGGEIKASTIAAEEAAIRKANAGPKAAAVKVFQEDAGTKYVDQLREQTSALYLQLSVGEKLTGAAKELAEFEQKIADLKGKTQLTAAQKSLQARQEDIRAGLQEKSLAEKLVQIEEDGAKKKLKAAQDLLGFQDRAAQLAEQIANAQEGRREGYARTLGGFGQSDSDRQCIEATNQLYREAERYQAQLTKSTPKDLLGSEEYIRQMMAIKGTLDTSLSDHDAYYKRLKELQGDWSLGASSALANYRDEAANVYRQVEQVGGSALRGLEDYFVSLATTGKASFKGLANAVIADIARMQAKMAVSKIASLLGGALTTYRYSGSSSDSSAPNYENSMDRGVQWARGGAFDRGVNFFAKGDVFDRATAFGMAGGRLGVMGEAGPEAIMPLKRGSDGKLGVAGGAGGGGPAQVTIVNNGAPATAQVQQSRTADGGLKLDVILNALDDALGDRIGSGQGSTARAMEGRYGLRTSVG
jgi:lambda family phage tail tape measure protein